MGPPPMAQTSKRSQRVCVAGLPTRQCNAAAAGRRGSKADAADDVTAPRPPLREEDKPGHGQGHGNGPVGPAWHGCGNQGGGSATDCETNCSIRLHRGGGPPFGKWGCGTEGAAAYDAMMEGRLSQHRKKIEKNWLDTSTLEPEEINGQPASASYVGYRPTVIN